MDDFASPPVSSPEDEAQGSRVLGILGAVIGAAVGAVPWFLVSTFAGWFVGWLGFLVGWAACVGYRKLGGYRSTRFATAAVIVASILALLLAEVASFIYAVCADADCQTVAAYHRISTFHLALLFLQVADVWRDLLPNLLIGMAVGVLGVFSARSHVLKYTDPEKAARMRAAQAAGCAPETFTTGMALPSSFTVRGRTAATVAGVICAVFFGLLLAASAVIALIGLENPADMLFPVIVFGALLALGVFMVLRAQARIEVTENSVRCYNGFGKWTEFHISEAESLALAPLNGVSKLYGRDGQVLAKFSSGMKNAPLFMQYLAEHNIGLRG